jgi:hypothetical protein
MVKLAPLAVRWQCASSAPAPCTSSGRAWRLTPERFGAPRGETKPLGSLGSQPRPRMLELGSRLYSRRSHCL